METFSLISQQEGGKGKEMNELAIGYEMCKLFIL